MLESMRDICTYMRRPGSFVDVSYLPRGKDKREFISIYMNDYSSMGPNPDEKIRRQADKDFIWGDGCERVSGFLHHPHEPNKVREGQSIGYIEREEGESLRLSLKRLAFSLDADYWDKGTFVVHPAVVLDLLEESPIMELPSSLKDVQLMGRPTLVLEDMPLPKPGAFAAAFGDFTRGYAIAEGASEFFRSISMERGGSPCYGGSQRIGGGVMDPEAIKLLRL